MIGQTLGHYRILEKIGAGGMGEVYRARDLRLERDVACKVLPAGLLHDDERRSQFRREALALAKLNHPNIASVYDFDTDAGVDFLVMEYIAGVNLSDRLGHGPLPQADILRLGSQLFDGLGAAHEQGVIHRDLKPANLRITTDGRLKILDFGLATLRRRDADGEATMTATQAGGVVGTLPYMAPEQLRGERTDARTDLYACGVILYEMATGRRPFEHQAATALAGQIQYETPAPPSQFATSVGPHLDAIILRCLEKAPARRYQSVRDLDVDLRRIGESPVSVTVAGPKTQPGLRNRRMFIVGAIAAIAAIAILTFYAGGTRGRVTGGARGAIASLAVLPLDNLSGDPSQDFFADGMTEALIENLSKIRALRVISRTSVMRFKGTTSPVPEIARTLGVDAVVQGSVQRTANRVRIRAQLVRADPEEHLWADNYDRQVTDILDLQGELAAAVAGEIQVNLTTQEQVRLARAQSVRPEVYEAYLRGRHELAGATADNWQGALGFFEQALAADAEFAPAYVGVAKAHIARGFAGAGQLAEVYAKARQSAARAIELDDSLADAHAAIGWVSMVADWNWAGAEREFRRALELDPSSADGRITYSTFLSAVGRHDEAIAEARMAVDLDPLSQEAIINLGWRYQGARAYPLAIEQYRKTMGGQDGSFASGNLAEVYALQGRLADARAEIDKVRPLLDGVPTLLALAAPIYAVAGQTADARKAIQQAVTLRAQGMYQSSTRLGLAHAFLGDRQQALDELERGFSEHDPWMVFINWAPQPDWLRTDDRFLDLVARMKFPN